MKQLISYFFTCYVVIVFLFSSSTMASDEYDSEPESALLASIKTHRRDLKADGKNACWCFGRSKKNRNKLLRKELDTVASLIKHNRPIAAYLHFSEFVSSGKNRFEKTFANQAEKLFLEILQKDDEKASDDDQCVVCCDKRACVVTIECFHMPFCEECMTAYQRDPRQNKLCPICRKETDFIKLNPELIRNRCFYCKKQKAKMLLMRSAILTCRDCHLNNLKTLYCCDQNNDCPLETFRSDDDASHVRMSEET